MRAAAEAAALAGRLALGAAALWAAWGHVAAPGALRAAIAKTGIAAVHLLYWGAVGVEVACGLMVALGWRTRFGAWLLAAWAAIAAVGPQRWTPLPSDPDRFVLWLALAGGFAHLALRGPGRFALGRG